MRNTQLLDGINMAKLAERRKQSIDLDKVGRIRAKNFLIGLLIGVITSVIFIIIIYNI